MSNPKRQKVAFFSQGTDDSKHLRGETLYIADYKYVNISSLVVLHKKAIVAVLELKVGTYLKK